MHALSINLKSNLDILDHLWSLYRGGIILRLGKRYLNSGVSCFLWEWRFDCILSRVITLGNLLIGQTKDGPYLRPHLPSTRQYIWAKAKGGVVAYPMTYYFIRSTFICSSSKPCSSLDQMSLVGTFYLVMFWTFICLHLHSFKAFVPYTCLIIFRLPLAKSNKCSLRYKRGWSAFATFRHCCRDLCKVVNCKGINHSEVNKSVWIMWTTWTK